MVEGMKNEARKYLFDGGTIVEYGKRLTERQEQEISFYKRIKDEIDRAKKQLSESEFVTFSEQKNDQLRNLGIKTIPVQSDD